MYSKTRKIITSVICDIILSSKELLFPTLWDYILEIEIKSYQLSSSLCFRYVFPFLIKRHGNDIEITPVVFCIMIFVGYCY